MATFTVTTVADDGAGSLRAAVAAANVSAGADLIDFDAGVFDGGSEDLIRLTSGQIEITDGLTITGGPLDVTITGDAAGDDVTLAGGVTDVDASLVGEDRLDDNSRIFNATAALMLNGLTLTGGRTIAEAESGGAVRGTTVTLIDSTISGNSTAGDNSEGGGVFGGFGGVTLTNSTVSGNSTAGDNSDGGGVRGDDVTLTNSTVSGNSTAGNYSEGGGAWGFDVTLTNSTVSGNSTAGRSSEGGGVHIFYGYGSNGGVALTNSILLGNATVFEGVDNDEVWGPVTRSGGNILGGDLFDGAADVGDVTAAEVFAATIEIAPGVLAGVLADNGGPTRTILIAADGPAVDAGGVATLSTDQRGLERVFGAAVDLGAVESGAGPVEPGSLIVTTALDVVANDGLTSLREAVFFANFERSADKITFDASVFDGEAADVIRLTGGQITLTDDLTIMGSPLGVTITGDAGGDDVTLVGGITDVDASLEGEDRLDDNGRIFDATADLTLDGLTLTGGRTMADGERGGAVRGVSVTLTNSVVSGNSTAGNLSQGGGVFSGFDVTLTNSTVSGNRTAGYNSAGGGVQGYDVTLTNSTVSGNSTAGDNAEGGGISGGGRGVTLTNSTISANSTAGDNSYGGGIYGFGDVTLTSSTVSGNSATGEGSGGGGVWSGWGGDRDVGLTNSIVVGNAAISAGTYGDEVEGPVTRTGGNILGSDLFDGDADVGDIAAAEVFVATTEIAPGVLAGALADNGGPTRTIAIRADGPAAGAADPASATETDQRGLARDDAPDLGAFEAGAEGGLKLVGGPGADVLAGGAGDDRICGRGGNDVLRGLAGDDLLRGGAGCDTLRGGVGDDLLSGGKGRDVFVFSSDPGADTIVSFDANPHWGQDRMDLRALGISAASFATAVTIEQTGDDTRVTLQGEGSILCKGIDGEGVAVIDQSDFLLLA